MLMRHSLAHLVLTWVASVLAAGGVCTAAYGGANKPVRVQDQPDEWFHGSEGRRAVENVLSWQSPRGSWPKNIDTSSEPYRGDASELRGTFDNGATTGELRLLARAFNVTADDRCARAVDRGIDHILAAQYPGGGWPQLYPPGNGYHRHVTFNDGTMVRLMELLREVARSPEFAFVGSQRRLAARKAFHRGVECILRCQVKVDGVLTAWCAQHDEVDDSPRPGRAFEPAALSGCETVDIVMLLMSLERPDERVVRSVEAAVAWLEAVKLPGLKVRQVDDATAPGGRDRRVFNDPSADPIWARFYEIGTNRPIFRGRDGVTRYRLAEIDHERRNGYAWLGYWPHTMLTRDYPAWKRRRATIKPMGVTGCGGGYQTALTVCAAQHRVLGTAVTNYAMDHQRRYTHDPRMVSVPEDLLRGNNYPQYNQQAPPRH